MKKLLTIAILSLLCVLYSNDSFAQKRFKLTKDVTMVSYGDTYWLEDDKNQMSISISVAQAGIDRRNNKKLYTVVCGDFTKTVVKTAVSTAVKEGIKHSVSSMGTSLIATAAGYAAGKIYNELCDYWGESFE